MKRLPLVVCCVALVVIVVTVIETAAVPSSNAFGKKRMPSRTPARNRLALVRYCCDAGQYFQTDHRADYRQICS